MSAVELVRARGDRLGQLARERVDLALVERGERLPGHVPLVQEEEGRAAGCASAAHALSAGQPAPRLLEEARRVAAARELLGAQDVARRGAVVGTPTTSSSASARSARSIAAGRSSSQTMSFARSES